MRTVDRTLFGGGRRPLRPAPRTASGTSMAGRAKKRMTESDSESDVFIPEEPAENPFVRWLLHPWFIVIIAAVVGVYVAGSHFWSWLPDLSHRPEYRLKAEEIRFTDPPKWVSKTFLRQVIHEGGLAEDLSLLDDRLVEQVAAAFQKNPWVAKVVSVRKDLARRLFVTLEYRKPVAVVEVGADRYSIDRSAVLLPAPETSENGDALPVVHNVHTVPPANVGFPWSDRLVEAQPGSPRFSGRRGRSSNSYRSRYPKRSARQDNWARAFTNWSRPIDRGSFGDGRRGPIIRAN